MPVSAEQFIESISISGILSAEEVTAIRAGLKTRKPAVDLQTLAQELVKSGKLTKFQAQAIYQGKAKGLVCGDYVFIDKIGVGGMGQVFKARHKRMNRIVAIKVLAPQATVGDKSKALQRFQQEVETAAQLMHPNIVTAYDANESQGLNYLVMEYVPGQDLHSSLKPDKKLPIDQVLDVILQAARGLEYAHSQGVIHRDIKPANLLLDTKGRVKILDMGLARVADTLSGADRAATDGLTQTGEVMGTVDYMAPEQARNTREADARADIYSLGCTLYRLATGQLPYEESTLVKKFLAHLERPVPKLSEHCPAATPRLQLALERMMAKKPEDRFQSMTELIVELEACRAGVPLDDHSPLVTDEPVASRGGSSMLNLSGGTGLSRRLPPLPTKSGDNSADDFSERRAARAQAAAAASKRRMLMVVGGISVAVILVVVNIVVFMRGRSQDNVDTPPVAAATGTKPEEAAPTETPEATTAPAVEEAKPVAAKVPATTTATMTTTTPAPAPTVATVEPTTQPAAAPALVLPLPPQGIDILKELDLKRDLVEGGWFRDGQSLLKAEDVATGRIQFNAAPPPEYDLHVNVQTLSNRSSFGIGLVVGASRVAFVMSHVQTGMGLSDLQGKRHYMGDNPTHRRDFIGFAVNTPMALVFRVRPGNIVVTLNSRTVVDWTGDVNDLKAPIAGPDPTKLFLFANGSTRFTQYDLMPPGVTPPQKAPDPSKVVSNRPGVATDLLRLVSTGQDALREGWKIDSNSLVQVPASTGPNRLELPFAVPREYELQVVAEPLMKDPGVLQIGLVVGEARGVFSLERISKVTGLEPILGKGYRDNATAIKHPEGWEQKIPLTVICRVRPDSVQVTLNGQRVVTWQGDFRDLSMARNSGDHTKLFIAGAAGGGNFIGSFRFTRLELIPMGVEPQPVPPEPAVAAVRTVVQDRLNALPAATNAPERVATIHQFRQEASTTDDNALRYALLTEATKLAVTSEQIALLVQLTGDMQRCFAGDALANLRTQLDEIVARNRPPAERRELAIDLLEVSADEIAAERFDLCSPLIKAANDAATKATDLELKKEIRNRELEADAWQKLFASVEAARQSLVANAADPYANYQLGRYLAVTCRQWPAALLLLSKGNNEAVKGAAEMEMRSRHDPTAAGAIGGLWLEAAESTEMPERAVYLDHASDWLTVGARRLKPGEQAKLAGRFKKLDTEVRRTAGTAYLPRHPLRAAMIGGHWYELITETVSWREAQARCEARGGRLVCLETAPECQAVYQLAAAQYGKPDTFYFWIGATEEGHDKQFVWINGVPVTFTDWDAGQPGKESNEAIVVKRTVLGSAIFKWIDTAPSDHNNFICEWER